MTPIEKRILENQYEILWAMSYVMSKIVPDLVGLGGELDRARDDLRHAAKETKELIK